MSEAARAPKTIVVTGGMGYVGSHIAVALLEAGYRVVIVDSCINADAQTATHLKTITGTAVDVYEADIRDRDRLSDVFAKHAVDTVIHCAGLKAVGESSERPLDYFDHNVVGTIRLAQVMRDFNCHRIIFSSSATVYGAAESNPITEDHPTGATNPYGTSKLVNEQLLAGLARCQPDWRVGILRYFNPIGAHASGLLGENRNNKPNNLMPHIVRVAAGIEPVLYVFGDDYHTKDGTGVRDYIHVMDLARGHLNALAALDEREYFVVNLGTGRGYSVLELVDIFQSATGQKVPYEITARRPGDVDACYADPTLAKTLLNWQSAETIETACRDMWAWQQRNDK